MNTLRVSLTAYFLCILQSMAFTSSSNRNSLLNDTTYVVKYVTSKDGTKIGYKQYGKGPGLLLVQGAMGIAYNYHQLASALSRDFTVYVPDRRGRRLSDLPYSKDHSIDRDVEDIDALVAETNAHYLFGLSSGAIIALEACRLIPAIKKAVVYEPPFYIKGVPFKKISQINKEIEEKNLGAALATVFSVVKVGPGIFHIAPRPILKLMTTAFIKSQTKTGTGEYAPLTELIPSMRYDFKVVLDRGDKVHLYKDLTTKIMLMGGSKSPKYLKNALDALEAIIPNVTKMQLKGLDHSGPWNDDEGGNPAVVANSLSKFFKE